MKLIDKLYQKAVDKEAEKVLKLTPEEISKLEDFGTIESTVDGKTIEIGFWHHKYKESLHHIVFQSERRTILFLNKKYLSGIKLENGVLTRLNAKEISDYD